MNEKQALIEGILNIVLECCNVNEDGQPLITKEDIISKKRNDDVVMARCIFVSQLMFAGISRMAVGVYLQRDERSIRNILNQAHTYRMTSKLYRKLEAETTLESKDLF